MPALLLFDAADEEAVETADGPGVDDRLVDPKPGREVDREEAPIE